MKSPRISIPEKNLEKGFTLVELMVVVGLSSLMFILGMIISMEFYRSYSHRSEVNVIASILQKARSQSMNNINQVRHGVRFQFNPLKYIIFECPTSTPKCTNYTTASSTDLIINPSYASSISNPSPLPFDVIFDQLSGNCVVSSGLTSFTCDSVNQPITISDGFKSYSITVNSEGQIDW